MLICNLVLNLMPLNPARMNSNFAVTTNVLQFHANYSLYSPNAALILNVKRKIRCAAMVNVRMTATSREGSKKVKLWLTGNSKHTIITIRTTTITIRTLTSLHILLI